MAITVPTVSGPQIQNRALSAPQTQSVTERSLAAEIAQPVANAALQIVEKVQQDADTAALVEAESQLSKWKLDTMFNPEQGVYSRKGKNALNITNQTLPEFDKQADAIGNSLTNERQRARWKEITTRQRHAFDSELNRYEYGERENYYDEADKASLEASQTGALAYYNDPQQVAYYQNKASAVLASAGNRKGLPPEAIELSVQKNNSAIATNVINRMMLDDPTKAAEYFSTAQGYMTPDDQAKVATALRPSLSQQYASDLFTAVRNGKTGAAMYWGAQIQAESGGRQFDAEGKPLTSSAGATGVAQIMPETGPEAAKLAGLAWDEERFKTNPGYNAALGKAYSNMLFKRYSNDPVLALAAYNAGMGNVDNAIAKAGDPRSTGDYDAFINALPKPEETGPYVEKIIAKSQPKKSEEYARLLEIGQSIPDQTTRKYYEAYVQDWKKAQDAAGVARFDEASSIVAEQGMARVPPQMLVGLPADEIKKLEEQDRRRREGVDPVTDPDKLEEFLGMPSAQLAELSLARDIQPHLSPADFSKVTTAWRAAKKGDKVTQEALKAEQQAIKSVMNLAGIKFGTSADAQASKNINARLQFENRYNTLRDAFVKEFGKEPSAREAQGLAERMLIDMKLSSGSRWIPDEDMQFWQIQPDKLKDAYIDAEDIDIDALSPTDRQTAVDLVQSKYGKEPSEKTIKRAYIEILESRGLKVTR
jgi:soluble lytic murein transglycosylase